MQALLVILRCVCEWAEYGLVIWMAKIHCTFHDSIKLAFQLTILSVRMMVSRARSRPMHSHMLHTDLFIVTFHWKSVGIFKAGHFYSPSLGAALCITICFVSKESFTILCCRSCSLSQLFTEMTYYILFLCLFMGNVTYSEWLSWVDGWRLKNFYRHIPFNVSLCARVSE